MKTAGWICLVFGVLAFLGAAAKGHSVFAPLFWIGLGIYLLYRVNNREDKREMKHVEPDHASSDKTQAQESVIMSVPETNHNEVQKLPNPQLESLEDIQAQLTLQQREAAMCLISFFGGYNNNLMDEAPIMLFKQSAIFFGLQDSPAVLSKIMSKYTDADTLVDIVLTIKPVKAKEFLLLTCYDLIKSSGKFEAQDLLFNIANDMGYDKTRFWQLIHFYQ